MSTIPTDDALSPGADRSPQARARLTDGPVAIEVRGVRKSFRIPEHRVDSLKERAARPFTRAEYRQLDALHDISFDVHRGEFFGIVGRNGSGKSTLLKILASIYRVDAGRVRMAGRVAPFIELGVGFNPEMTAKENVTLNGVLFGLSRRQAQGILDTVLDFAELRDFSELKIKNYSSGMMVRLAFAIMVQADADIMLIDEVLAVGDAAFGQKCMDVFYERRDAGKTIVLVTHDMMTVQDLCDRAVVIHDGEMEYCGDSERAAMRYFQLNFAREVQQGLPDGELPDQIARHEFSVRLLHAHILDARGARAANLEQDAPLSIDVGMVALRDLENPVFVFHVRNVDGVVVFAFSRWLREHVAEGQRVRFTGEIENRLVPGSYTMECWTSEARQTGDMGLQALRVLAFVVYGTAPRHGVVSVQADVDVRLEREP